PGGGGRPAGRAPAARRLSGARPFRVDDRHQPRRPPGRARRVREVVSSLMSAAIAEPHRRIRVLIVDDSASVRTTLSDIIAADPDLEVMATAADPYVAVERIRHEVPDVIFLDLEMPRMDGLTFLRKLMSQRPIPVVICSGVAQAGSDTLMQCLEAGAV